MKLSWIKKFERNYAWFWCLFGNFSPLPLYNEAFLFLKFLWLLPAKYFIIFLITSYFFHWQVAIFYLTEPNSVLNPESVSQSPCGLNLTQRLALSLSLIRLALWLNPITQTDNFISRLWKGKSDFSIGMRFMLPFLMWNHVIQSFNLNNGTTWWEPMTPVRGWPKWVLFIYKKKCIIVFRYWKPHSSFLLQPLSAQKQHFWVIYIFIAILIQ